MEWTPLRRSPRFAADAAITENVANTAAIAFDVSATTAATVVDVSATTAATVVDMSITTAATTATLANIAGATATVGSTAVGANNSQNDASILSALIDRMNHLDQELRSVRSQLQGSEHQRGRLEQVLREFISPSATSASGLQTPSVSFSHAIQLPAQTVSPFVNSNMPPSLAENCTTTASPATRNSISPQPNSEQMPTATNILNNMPIAAHPYSSALTADHSQMNSSSAMSLPYLAGPRKIQDLPDFSGQPEDWPMFATAYEQSTAAYKYTELENCQRLQKCLKGAAKETVQSLLIHPNNVSAVMDQLRFRYGRPEPLIHSQLRKIREITPVTETNIEHLIPLAIKVRNLTGFLQSINGQQHLSNPTLLDELINKLPMSKRIEWARRAVTIQPYATICEFSSWLTEMANFISVVQGVSPVVPDTRKRVVLHTFDNTQSRNIACITCGGTHEIHKCKEFLKFDIKKRWQEVKGKHLCFTCLQAGHTVRNFRRRKPCLIERCQKRHHQLLHERESHVSKNASMPSATQQANVELLHVSQDQGTLYKREFPLSNDGISLNASGMVKGNILLRVLPVTLYGPNKKIEIYALFDEGSTVTMIDNSVLKLLGIKGRECSLNIQWFGGKAASEPATLVDLHISDIEGTRKQALKNIYGVSNLKLPMQSIKPSELEQIRDHQLPMEPYSDITPQLLIGLDHCHLGIPIESITLKKDGPYASKTELGWVVFGPSNEHTQVASCLMMNNASVCELHELVAEYFSTENFGVRAAPAVESEADKRSRDILQATTVKKNGRYQVGLLWKYDDVKLPDSFAMAKQRLLGIERKMRKDERFAELYKAAMKSYEDKNYARKLTPKEAAIRSPRTWYIPHFAVVNPNKPGKFRLVFDAAAKVDGVSLNSYLLKGPLEYNSMTSVLFNFRIGAVAVCADIREMFHQVLVRPEDRCSQRFLWRDGDPTRPVAVHEMTVMTFGAACSPCAAQHVKNINAKNHHKHDPRAIKGILQHHYVDDFVDSFETDEHAIEISKQICTIHKDAGFELRNFISNSLEAVNALEGNMAVRRMQQNDPSMEKF